MREGWEIKKLGEVCKISPPKSEVRSMSLSADDIVSFLPMEDLCINKKYISVSKQKALSEVASGYTYFVNDDVLLAKVTPCFENGKVGIAKNMTNGVGFGSSEYIVLRADKSKVIADYIYYILNSNDFRLAGATLMTGASGLKRLPKPYVFDYLINVPPIVEQQRIVNILDTAFAKIDAMRSNAEKNLQSAKDLFQAALKQELSSKEGWKTSTLQEECFKITDGTHQTPKYFDNGVIFLSSKNVTSRKIDWVNIKYIDQIQHEAMSKRVSPMIGDILLAKNGTTGVAAMVDRDIIFDIYVSLAWLRSLGNVTPAFLLLFLNSPIAKRQFNNRLKGSGVPNLHLEEIRQVQISYPKDLNEQQAIVTKLDTLSDRYNQLEQNYQQTIEHCQALKQAILTKAFNGEL